MHAAIAPATATNTSFSQSIPGLQIVWDSTSLSAFKTCPRLYLYSIVLGRQPRGSRVDLDFGIWMHSGREQYYLERARGQTHEQAIRHAVVWILDATWNRTLGRGWVSGDPNKNRFTLLRTLVWYLDRWRDDPLQTIILANGKPAVELSFQFAIPLEAPSGDHIRLSGHLDRVVNFNGDTYLTDLKTTKHTLSQEYFSQFTPDNQMSFYSVASEVVFGLPVQGLIVDAAQVAVTFSRFGRGLVTRTRSQLDEWFEDTQHYLQSAMDMAVAQHWPMNDKACFRCAFREACSLPPGDRMEYLSNAFTTRVWDPAKSR